MIDEEIEGVYVVEDASFGRADDGTLTLTIRGRRYADDASIQREWVRDALWDLLRQYDDTFEWRHPVDVGALTEHVCRLLGVGEAQA